MRLARLGQHPSVVAQRRRPRALFVLQVGEPFVGQLSEQHAPATALFGILFEQELVRVMLPGQL
jgi:hypothetical protein